MIKQRNITLIVVHCTASKCTSNLTPEALDALHKRQGFTECGYHYYITKDGTIHHMRDITHVGAHAKGYNTPSIGIAYEGGLDASGRAADTRTTAQKQSLEILLRFLLLSYPAAKIWVIVTSHPISTTTEPSNPASTSNSVPVSVSPSNTVI